MDFQGYRDLKATEVIPVLLVVTDCQDLKENQETQD
jgi:hypothetical protein